MGEVSPSFRSTFFNVGEGLIELLPGETKVMASKTPPQHHASVLTGFSQGFDQVDDTTLVVWALKIEGKPLPKFGRFIGEKGCMLLPCPMHTPVLPEEQATLEATNNADIPVVLSGRLVGFEFPTT